MFKNRLFKIVSAVIVIILGMALYAGVNGKLTTFPQEVMGAVSMPFRQVTAKMSHKVSVWKDRTLNIDEIIAENEKLREENHQLKKNQVDYDKIRQENKEYKEFFGIKEENPDFEIVSASVVGRDGLDKFSTFTVDAGEKDGVEINDVVMSSQGVVGVVVETGRNYSKVYTILNPSVSVACFVSSTRDTGIVTGEGAYSNEGKTIIHYLPKNTKAKQGDIISTTGMGEVFPEGLVLGTIESIHKDTSGNYNYAVVIPEAEISEVKTVFIIKSYQ